MNYQELKTLLAEGDFKKINEALTSQVDQPEIDNLKKQWDVTKHNIFDYGKRPDRTVMYEDPDKKDADGNPVIEKRIESVSRIPVPFQKAIVSKAVSFLFGNPVNVTAQTTNEKEQIALSSILKIWEDNKLDSQNRMVARQLFRSKQVCEIWYPIELEDRQDVYGIKSKFRLRMSVFSPWDDSILYPYFDDYGDMIAFCRSYKVKGTDGKNIECFDVFTADVIQKWRKGGPESENSDWTVETTENIIKKIPVVYADQEQAEWQDVQYAIERLETLLSNHADTNDYNGSPTVVAKGNILSIGKKGEQGKLLEIEEGGDVKYLSWDHAPESVKMEIENLFRIIYAFTQTPDISFESVKGISSISGIALKLLFMDAHLKVKEKQEIFDSYLTRRINILKAFLSKMDTANAEVYKNLIVTCKIKPFIIEDIKEVIESLVNASGGKALISQKTAIREAGFVSNAEDEYKRIRVEETEAMSFSVTENGELGSNE